MASILSPRNARLNESTMRIIQSPAMSPTARAALGSLLGAAVAGAIAPLIRPLFHPPGGGIGFVTVHAYPKTWDYAVLALLVLGAFVGGSSGSRVLGSSVPS